VERLCKKGLIERHLSGEASLYRPLVAREVVEAERTRKAASRLFGAPPLAPVAALVDEADTIDPELVDQLERVISRRRWKDGA
jgi:predicted transcriptional regulator